MVCTVSVPKFASCENRLVLDAVVENSEVVVAAVVVDLSPVKFWRVVEPET